MSADGGVVQGLGGLVDKWMGGWKGLVDEMMEGIGGWVVERDWWMGV